MILVDTALAKRQAENRPLRIGLVGAGYMGRGIALHFLDSVVGMRLVAVSNRTIADAARAYAQGGIEDPRVVTNSGDLETAIAAGKPAITDDATLLCVADGIDVLIESTGEIEFGAHIALEAIKSGKHVVLMNAEMDATIGPILKVYADRQGVVVTNTDGDEPGVAMNLFRFVRTVGYRPVAAGNLKGMIDPYRTPETQKAFAEKYHQKPRMITSFADGTKLSMECTILSNATGLRVGKRGMYGPKCAHVKEAIGAFPENQLMNGGLVDYLLGAEPHTGAWVLAHTENPIKRQYMNYFKMGDGPLYVFYTPYHLPHVQIVDTVARAGLFGDATVAPIGGPVCEVLTMAKKDLTIGETLDGIGGFTCYGTIDNADVMRRENLLPMGLSEGCKLKRDVAKDQPIGNDDVVFPSGRLCDRLRLEQDRLFAVDTRRKS
jgi:predicted homoserine dehydrogenase-like protein